MNTRSVLLSSLTALALSGASSLATADGQTGSESPLVGTWVVTINPYVCATGELLPFIFDNYITFGRGGTLVEAASNPAFEPGQRSPGHGFWERSGPNRYRAVFQAFVQFTSVVTPPTPPQYERGTQRVDSSIELVDRDHWKGSAIVSFFDAAGTPLRSGCMVAKARRMD